MCMRSTSSTAAGARAHGAHATLRRNSSNDHESSSQSATSCSTSSSVSSSSSPLYFPSLPSFLASGARARAPLLASFLSSAPLMSIPSSSSSCSTSSAAPQVSLRFDESMNIY